MHTGKKKIPEDLEKYVKSCPTDFKTAENLIGRAGKDLRSAELLSNQDIEAAYTLLYDCMLHAGLAYMAASGVRADTRGKHRTVVLYLEHLTKSYRRHCEPREAGRSNLQACRLLRRGYAAPRNDGFVRCS